MTDVKVPTLSESLSNLQRDCEEAHNLLADLHSRLIGRPPIRIDHAAASHPFGERAALREAGVVLFTPGTQDAANKLGRLLGVLLSAGAAVYGADEERTNLYEVVAALAQAGFGEKPGH